MLGLNSFVSTKLVTFGSYSLEVEALIEALLGYLLGGLPGGLLGGGLFSGGLLSGLLAHLLVALDSTYVKLVDAVALGAAFVPFLVIDPDDKAVEKAVWNDARSFRMLGVLAAPTHLVPKHQSVFPGGLSKPNFFGGC